MRRFLFILAAAAFLAAGPAHAKDQIIAKVNGKTIKQSDVHRRLLSLKGVEVLDRLIERKLIEQKAKTLKIGADKKEVQTRLDAIKQQLPAGTSFEDRLKASGITLNGLKSDITYQILTDKLILIYAAQWGS